MGGKHMTSLPNSRSSAVVKLVLHVTSCNVMGNQKLATRPSYGIQTHAVVDLSSCLHQATAASSWNLE